MPRTILTDAQWSRIAPLLPGKAGDRGRTGEDNHRSREGMIWVLRTRAPWRDLPTHFGKWHTVYQRFRRWERRGVFEQVFSASQGGIDLTSVQVDGFFVKVHQHGTGAPKGLAPRTPKPSGSVAGGEPPS